MKNSTLKNIVKKRWFRVCLILLLTSILLVFLYGRQTLATYLIYNKGEKQKSYLHIIPELRHLTPAIVKDRTEFKAFGYKFEIPLNKSPQYLNLDTGKGIIYLGEYGIIIQKPKDHPLNMYQHFKLSNKADDVSHFQLVFEHKFNNNFEFVKSCFYSKPTLLSIFKPIEETTLLYYQQIDKWLYSNAGLQIPKRIYYFEAEHCKGFQIGDPSSLEKVTLWLFPESDKEIEIHIQGVEVGKLKQADIDFIISTFGESSKDTV